MTRRTGQITGGQALLAALLAVAVAAGIVAALTLLEAGHREPPLAAPAVPATVPRCPEPDRSTAPEPATVTASELIECPRSYDGRLVAYEGEVVRAVLRRGGRAWVHLNDDPYALSIGPLPDHRTAVGGNSGIPVTIPGEVADRITHVGGHRFHGDVLAITGVFHRAAPFDAGGPAIHARTACISQPGRPLPRRVDAARTATALTLAVAAGAAALFARRRRLSP